MRQALYAGSDTKTTTQSLSNWADLPGLCCQAAGGHPEWADDLAVAWLLFYFAADLMDKVQDQDEPDPWWHGQDSGAVLSVATGLYFTASLALTQLFAHGSTIISIPDIITDYYQSLLVMTGGQYRELENSTPTLEQYWEFAAAKSGKFFGLGCRSGAHLVTHEHLILDSFERFGHHLGMLVQIRDDLDDIRPPSDDAAYGQRAEITHSLPVIYALSVLPSDEKELLCKCLQAASQDAMAAKELIRLLNQSNATLYLVTELEHHRRSAQDALYRAAMPSPAREALEAYIWKL